MSNGKSSASYTNVNVAVLPSLVILPLSAPGSQLAVSTCFKSPTTKTSPSGELAGNVTVNVTVTSVTSSPVPKTLTGNDLVSLSSPSVKVASKFTVVSAAGLETVIVVSLFAVAPTVKILVLSDSQAIATSPSAAATLKSAETSA